MPRASRKKYKVDERVPLFRCDCEGKEREQQWTIVETNYGGPWCVVGCSVCHAIGRVKSVKCSAFKCDQGEYELALRVAVQRTERVARYAEECRPRRGEGSRDTKLHYIRLRPRNWPGHHEYRERRKMKGTEINSWMEGCSDDG